MHCPLCQVGCVALPEDFTCPPSLDETGKFDWTSRSLHLSCHAGQARSTGRQKPSLVLSHWTGQVDWTLCTNCQKPSLVQPLSAGQVGWTFLRLFFLESLTCLGTLSQESLTPPTPFFGSLGSDIHRLCQRPTYKTQNQKETTTGKPGPTPVTTRIAVELQCGGGCAGVLGRCGVTPVL